MGCPIIHRRELQENLKGHRERLSNIKSTIDTRPPAPQPHLTLYGRDYAAKKKATTEAAFADLKMIQAIARTMTRKHEIAERKGPVSLNADSRKQEIYRVMHENHKLLDHIESVEPFCNVREMVADHRFKQRYVINASHTMRLSGEYDQELARIRREDQVKFEVSQRSIQLRREAAERLAKNSGSVSLPSLASASMSESAPAPAATQGAKKAAGPARVRKVSPGDAQATEEKGSGKQQAKPAKSRTPSPTPATAPSKPSSARLAPRPAVRFTYASPAAAASSSPGSASRASSSPAGPKPAEAAGEVSPQTPKNVVEAPSQADLEAYEEAQVTAEELEKAALDESALEEAILVEDDFAADPQPPPAPPPPQLAAPDEAAPDEAAPDEVAPKAPVYRADSYEEDFDVEPEPAQPTAVEPKTAEPPPDSYKATPSPTVLVKAREADWPESGSFDEEDSPSPDDLAQAPMPPEEAPAPAEEAVEPTKTLPPLVPMMTPKGMTLQSEGVKDQSQDEYEDDYEDEFVNESATLGNRTQDQNLDSGGFEDSAAFDDAVEEVPDDEGET